MRLKRYLVLLTAVLFCLSFAACLPNQKADKKETTSEQKTTEQIIMEPVTKKSGHVVVIDAGHQAHGNSERAAVANEAKADAYQDKIARGIANGIDKYFE